MKKLGWVKIIGMILLGLALLYRIGGLLKPETVKMDVSSLLAHVTDIAELSTAEFKYRGIAEVYSDENRDKIQCRVCYNAVVKAGIDMEKIVFEVDQENKVITAILPEIDLDVSIDDEQSMVLLPSDADVELDIMRKYCKEDAENEAKNSSELISTAQDNLQATIEGFLSPICKTSGYSFGVEMKKENIR